MRWIDAYFPFTHPSFELEIRHQDKWIEMLGCGVVESEILRNSSSSFDRHIAFAVGFGLERLAMIKYSIPDIRLFWTKDSGVTSQFVGRSHQDHFKYRPISNHPQSYNDCSFWLDRPGQPNEQDFNELVREVGGDLIEQVQLIDQFQDKKGRQSNCYRIVYRSYERTLTKSEVNQLHDQIKQVVIDKFSVQMRS
jgi:phenylalanyl-tRNA synthetase alpha chain